MKLPRFAGVALAALALASCSGNVIADVFGGDGPAEAFATPGRSLQIGVHQELRLTIRTIGPGSYAAPPEMDGSTLTFVDATLADVQVPAGPTQIFRFVGTARGTTIVRFHNTYSDRVVVDTVLVN